MVSDLAAMRPRLAQGAAAAVNQAAPIAPAAVIVATPTLAPAAIWPTDQAAAAVPDIAVTFTDSTGCQDCGTVVPAPWQMAPTAAPSPSGAGAELLHPTAALIDVARYGRAIDYCLVGSWSDPQRAAVASGLAIWQPSGVAFHEAATMADCETAVSWSNDLGPAIAGRATVGPGEIMLSPFWAANGCDLAMMAAHEAGHNLGLNDQPPAAGGLMRNDDCYQTGPTAAELAAVASLWGTK